jgi:hypothetical protein
MNTCVCFQCKYLSERKDFDQKLKSFFVNTHMCGQSLVVCEKHAKFHEFLWSVIQPRFV